MTLLKYPTVLVRIFVFLLAIASKQLSLCQDEHRHIASVESPLRRDKHIHRCLKQFQSFNVKHGKQVYGLVYGNLYQLFKAFKARSIDGIKQTFMAALRKHAHAKNRDFFEL